MPYAPPSAAHAPRHSRPAARPRRRHRDGPGPRGRGDRRSSAHERAKGERRRVHCRNIQFARGVIRSYANRLDKPAGQRKAARVRDINADDGAVGFTHGPARMQPASVSVRNWLAVVAAMIFLMIVLGALTRLTESGLSMVEWKPVTGWLPPLGDQAWQAELQKYLSSPQGRLVNRGFDVAEFKQIFWLEYLHRLWGRLIGVAVALPLAVVLAARAALAVAEAATVCPAGPGRPARRAGLGDGRLGPGRPPLGQPLPARRPSAAGDRALWLHGLAGARARLGAAPRRSQDPARSDRDDRLPARRADLRRPDGGPARRHARTTPSPPCRATGSRPACSTCRRGGSIRSRTARPSSSSIAGSPSSWCWACSRSRSARAGPRRWPPAPWRWCSSASELPRS